MDKTLEIVIVAAILLMAAAIVGFLVSDKAGGIGGWADNSTSNANCDLMKTDYRNNYCSDETAGSDLLDRIDSKCEGSTSHSSLCS